MRGTQLHIHLITERRIIIMKIRDERNGDFIFQEYEDGNGILLDIESGCVYLLNATALLLYRLCDGSREKAEVFEAFMGCIEIGDEDNDGNDIGADFDSILNEFEVNDILGRVVCQEADESCVVLRLKYVKPLMDIFRLEDLLEEIEGRKTTSAHCSHCYGTFG